MPSELILVLLHPEVPLTGRKSVQHRLARLGAVFQFEFKDGFLVRTEGKLASQVRSWKEVRVAGGVHFKGRKVSQPIKIRKDEQGAVTG